MSATELEDLRREVRRLTDVEAIRRLKHAYCRFNDGGWPRQGPSHMGATADLFAEDGVWDGRPVAPLAEGRAAIREMILGYREVSPFVVHDVMNPEIQVVGDSATGHWSALIFSTLNNGASTLAVSEYHDEFVRTPDGWRFKRLRYTMIRAVPLGFVSEADLALTPKPEI